MKRLIFLLICLIGFSCGKGGGSNPQPAINPPAKAILSLPAQNEACTTGTVISATESTVSFTWQTAANADSYELSIKNLNTNAVISRTTSSTSENVILARNTPYSWYVTSKSTKITTTAQSDTWKFYNSGPGTVAYAPFPAEILSPTMNQAVTASAGKITLDWNGTDVDNDITTYDIYLGTTSTPALLQSNVTASILSNVSVNNATSYYWKVITKDSKGNTSDSGLYRFSVN
jgi:hypothetical protein